MRSPTSLHESRVYGPENFRSSVQKDFCNTIPQERIFGIVAEGVGNRPATMHVTNNGCQWLPSVSSRLPDGCPQLPRHMATTATGAYRAPLTVASPVSVTSWQPLAQHIFRPTSHLLPARPFANSIVDTGKVGGAIAPKRALISRPGVHWPLDRERG